jgi:hypothetical protein
VTDAELRFVVRLAINLHQPLLRTSPNPGDLVVEVTRMRMDPDAIGWLIAHGQAPWFAGTKVADGILDGVGPMREVWDIEPLSGRGPLHGPWRPQRWENAQFMALPDAIAELARQAFPRKWDQGRMRPI